MSFLLFLSSDKKLFYFSVWFESLYNNWLGFFVTAAALNCLQWFSPKHKAVSEYNECFNLISKILSSFLTLLQFHPVVKGLNKCETHPWHRLTALSCSMLRKLSNLKLWVWWVPVRMRASSDTISHSTSLFDNYSLFLQSSVEEVDGGCQCQISPLRSVKDASYGSHPYSNNTGYILKYNWGSYPETNSCTVVILCSLFVTVTLIHHTKASCFRRHSSGF